MYNTTGFVTSVLVPIRKFVPFEYWKVAKFDFDIHLAVVEEVNSSAIVRLDGSVALTTNRDVKELRINK